MRSVSVFVLACLPLAALGCVDSPHGHVVVEERVAYHREPDFVVVREDDWHHRGWSDERHYDTWERDHERHQEQWAADHERHQEAWQAAHNEHVAEHDAAHAQHQAEWQAAHNQHVAEHDAAHAKHVAEHDQHASSN